MCLGRTLLFFRQYPNNNIGGWGCFWHKKHILGGGYKLAGDLGWPTCLVKIKKPLTITLCYKYNPDIHILFIHAPDEQCCLFMPEQCCLFMPQMNNVVCSCPRWIMLFVHAQGEQCCLFMPEQCCLFMPEVNNVVCSCPRWINVVCSCPRWTMSIVQARTMLYVHARGDHCSLFMPEQCCLFMPEVNNISSIISQWPATL